MGYRNCFTLLLERNHRKQGKKDEMSNTSTPYDDAQRTLSVDCPSLLIPLVNEAFQTNYPLDADVKLYNNEFFIIYQTVYKSNDRQSGNVPCKPV